jgi:hypothetical protein
VIATGEEGEKVNLKICLAGELNPGLPNEHENQDVYMVMSTLVYCIFRYVQHSSYLINFYVHANFFLIMI